MWITLKKAWLGYQPGQRVEVPDQTGEAMLRDGLAEKAADSLVPELLAKAMEGLSGHLSAAIQKSTETALKEFARVRTHSYRGQVSRIFGEGGEGDPKESFGSFLLAVRVNDRKALEDMGSRYCDWDNLGQKSTLVTQQGDLGGFAVPTQHYDRIMQLAIDKSVVRPRAMIIPMSGRTVQIPYLDHTAVQTAGESAYLGGMALNWTEEAASITEDNPKLKMAELTNYECSGYTPVSNTLSQDFVGLEAFLFRLFSDAVAWTEDYNFLRGSGVGRPLGAITWAGFVSVTRSAASAFALADYAGVLARWLGDYNPNSCCWVCHPTVLAKLIQIVSTSSGIPMFVDNVREKPRMMLGGLPLEVSEKVPALNTAGDVGVYDWSKYVIGDRRQIEVAFSPHYLFKNNQTAWRVVARCGGMPWLRDKITLADATSTLSPFVGLAAG